MLKDMHKLFLAAGMHALYVAHSSAMSDRDAAHTKSHLTATVVAIPKVKIEVKVHFHCALQHCSVPRRAWQQYMQPQLICQQPQLIDDNKPEGVTLMYMA